MKKALLALLPLILISMVNISQAQTIYGTYEITIVKIHRADLLTIRVHLWPGLTRTTLLKLKDINAPYTEPGEKNNQRIPNCEIALGRKAQQFAMDFIKNKRVFLSDVAPSTTPDKVLGKLSVARGGSAIFLSHALLRSGLAEPYKAQQTIWSCY